MSGFDAALAALLTLPRFGAAGVNERMAILCQPLMNTHWWKKACCLKIVGSNGKGSTASMAGRLAIAHGYKVGLYTSPHIMDVCERIQVDGVNIAPDDFAEALTWAQSQIGPMANVGRFEVLTLAALYHFAEQDVDLAVMEVGLGGRFDPVRIAPGRVSLLTSLDLEHTAILGDTLEKIAREKTAICQAGDVLVSGVVLAHHNLPDAVTGLYPDIYFTNQTNPRLARLGGHQIANANLAFGGLQKLLPGAWDPVMARGVLETWQIAGRLDVLSSDPLIYGDVAHSPAALISVLDVLAARHPDFQCSLLLGVRQDKDVAGLAKALDGRVTRIACVCPADGMRTALSLATALGAEAVPYDTVEAALHAHQAAAGTHDYLLVVGGFDLVAEVNALLVHGEKRSFVRI